jgi:hypothetical protein
MELTKYFTISPPSPKQAMSFHSTAKVSKLFHLEFGPADCGEFV